MKNYFYAREDVFSLVDCATDVLKLYDVITYPIILCVSEYIYSEGFISHRDNVIMTS